MISIDGDTSTNDMVSILASGEAENKEIECNDKDYEIFVNALYVVMMNLSRALASDGEGASKLLECTVTGAPDDNTARVIAKSVITSSLFKAAMFGSDANWGRVLCAIGYADADFDIDDIAVTLLLKQEASTSASTGLGLTLMKIPLKKYSVRTKLKF